jgi:hypothetical protein
MNMRGPATLFDCEAALKRITAAPKDAAVINELCVRPNFGQREYPPEIELTREQGISGDRWRTHPWLTLPHGEPDPRIQVSILSKRVMDLCWRSCITTPHPGDLLVVDMDLSEENLPPGSILRAGEATPEVGDRFISACVKWRRRYGDGSYKWINLPKNRHLRLRGILCQIVQNGTVRVGDELRIEPRR